MFMPVIVDDLCQDTSGTGRPTNDLIDWRQRYEGVLTVAYLDGKAVAGISGPWPVNQFALTWWDRPVPARQLELFDSLEAAQARVEEWAWRMRTIGVIDRPPANDPILPEATVSIAPPRQRSVPQDTWLGRLREVIAPAPRMKALRHPPLNDDDLRDIHLSAYE
jgi:hypothetical protein